MSKKLQRGVIKILGAIGYVSIVLQWLQLGLVWLPGFFGSRLGRAIFPQTHTAPHPSQPLSLGGNPTVSPDFVTNFLLTALALVAVGFVVYIVVVRYTRTINNTSSRVAHVVAEKAVHIVAHKPLEQIPARKRTILTRRLLFWTKLVFAVFPFVLLPIAIHHGERGIVEQLAIFVQAVLATIATTSFFVQAMLAARWHEHTNNIN